MELAFACFLCFTISRNEMLELVLLQQVKPSELDKVICTSPNEEFVEMICGVLVIRRMQTAGNPAFFSDNILFLSTGASPATSESHKRQLDRKRR